MFDCIRPSAIQNFPLIIYNENKVRSGIRISAYFSAKDSADQSDMNCNERKVVREI